MGETRKAIETIEMDCSEEKRRATLLVQWTEVDGVRTLTGVQCDNPKLQSLDNWQCEWSCWQKVEKLAEQALED